MKRISLLLLLYLSYMSSSYANNGVESGAKIVATTAGAVFGLHAFGEHVRTPKEIQAFAREDVGETIDMTKSCGVITYFKFVSYRRHMYGAFVFVNESNESKFYSQNKTKIIIDDGIELTNFVGAIPSDLYELKSKSYAVQLIKIDDKRVFKKKKNIKIQTFFSNSKNKEYCEQQLSFVKNKNFKEESEDIFDQRGTYIDMGMDVGGIISAGGDTKDIAGSGGSLLNIYFDFFPSTKHGFYLNTLGKTYNGDFDSIQSELEYNNSDSLYLHGIGVGYIYRHHFSEDKKLQFYLGATSGTIDERRDNDTEDVAKLFQWDAKLMYNYVTYREHFGHNAGMEYGVGIGVAYSQITKMEFENESLTGNDLGVVFRLFMGQ